MRNVPVLAVLVSLLLVPQTGASTALVVLDPANDDGIWGGASATDGAGLGTWLGELADCSSPAADLRQMTVHTDDETLTMSLTVEAFSLDLECSIVSSSNSAAGAEYYVTLGRLVRGPYEGPGAVRAMAMTTGFGMSSCIGLEFEDGFTESCLGEMSFANGSLTWTLPLEGIVTVALDSESMDKETFFEERAYDLRGRVVEARGEAIVRVEHPFGFVTIFDDARANEPFAL